MRDVAHDGGLRVDCGKVGHRVYRDVADRLRSGSQLHGTGGGGGNVGHMLGARLDDMVDGLDDGGVRCRSGVSDDGGLEVGRRHYASVGWR